MTAQSHYPSFHVMDEEDAWDSHTQSIVNSRLKETPDLDYLTRAEADMLFVVCGLLVNDDCPEVLSFVIRHIDQTLHSSPGEGQRKQGVPAGKDLVRQGLQALDLFAKDEYDSSFLELEAAAQEKLLQDVGAGNAKPQSAWNGVPQQPFFQKLMSLTVESYCSHPRIWSEIGYAGPAYPRGYVRTQLGQRDPWEAKEER